MLGRTWGGDLGHHVIYMAYMAIYREGERESIYIYEEYISEMAKRYLNMIREGAESIGEQKLYSWMASLGGPGVINI